MLLVPALTPAFIGAQTQQLRPVLPRPLWPVAAAPLSVWIQPSPAGTNSDSLSHAVRRAMGAWNAQRLPVRMRHRADSLTADVHIVWTDRFSEPISGLTTCVDDGAGRLVRASVVLAVKHSDGRVLGGEETCALALHELGHVIGLDHSASSTSVMSPRVRVRHISAEDRATALRLYSTP